MSTRKHRPEQGFFDSEELLQRVARTDHVLYRLDKLVDWSIFKPVLDTVFEKPAKGPGGRPPFDRTMMFKVMVIKHLYNIPDGQMEQRLLGDLFFRTFLGLTYADPTPDEKTIWFYHNELCQAGVILDLFAAFDDELKKKGLIAKEGIVIDASIVSAPVQHFRKEETKALEKGEIPELWKEHPAIESQRDTDASWTKKNERSYFGYKNHIKIDRKSKLVRSFEVTPAKDHDSQFVGTLIDKEQDGGEECHADLGYIGEPIKELFKKNRIRDKRHRKAAPKQELNSYQKQQNKKKSKVRARVEHVFGDMAMKMSDVRVRTIGRIRATFVIGMRNIVYNMCRSEFLTRRT